MFARVSAIFAQGICDRERKNCCFSSEYSLQQLSPYACCIRKDKTTTAYPKLDGQTQNFRTDRLAKNGDPSLIYIFHPWHEKSKGLFHLHRKCAVGGGKAHLLQI